MKLPIASMAILFVASASAALPKKYTVDCVHLAGTEVVDHIQLQYTSVKDQWSKKVKVTTVSDEWVMSNQEVMGSLMGDVRNHWVPDESTVYFEPCVDCDFDSAKISYSYDDDFGKLATLSYVSDGPTFTQFLKCTEK